MKTILFQYETGGKTDKDIEFLKKYYNQKVGTKTLLKLIDVVMMKIKG